MNIIIPDEYQAAIKDALNQTGKTVSTLKVKDVLNKLPDNRQDFLSAQFYTKEYKRQNKRVPKLANLLNAANDALASLTEGSNEFNQLQAAIALFDKQESTEGEF